MTTTNQTTPSSKTWILTSPEVKSRQPYARPVRAHRKRTAYNRSSFKRGHLE